MITINSKYEKKDIKKYGIKVVTVLMLSIFTMAFFPVQTRADVIDEPEGFFDQEIDAMDEYVSRQGRGFSNPDADEENSADKNVAENSFPIIPVLIIAGAVLIVTAISVGILIYIRKKQINEDVNIDSI